MIKYLIGLLASLILVGCNTNELPTVWSNSSAALSSSAASSSSGLVYGTMVDKAGNTYTTVQVDSSAWTIQNLRYLDTNSSGIRCSSKLSATECDSTGGYYNYKTAQTVCPSPWRLPRDADWRKLILKAALLSNASCQSSPLSASAKSSPSFVRFPADTTLGNCLGDGGNALKSVTAWGSFGGNNILGFNGTPEGYIDISTELLEQNAYGYYWSADSVAHPIYPEDSLSASSWYLTKSSLIVHEINDRTVWMSVRCVKDL